MNTKKFIYDPALFAEVTQVVVDELSAYMTRTHQLPLSTVHAGSPSDLVRQASQHLQTHQQVPDSSAQIVAQAKSLVQEILASTTRLHSPHYMGHQVNPPIPIAASFATLAALLNPGLAVFEMSQFPAAIEKALIAKLGTYLAWPESSFEGIVTSGGTLANLTALLSARNWKFKNTFSQGIGNSKPAILAGADSHYSISRAAGVLGIGADQVIKIPVDTKRRLDPSQLRPVFARARESGLEPFCVVATSGSTPVGAFDELREIDKFATEYNLWFHVDAAHGGSLLLSEKYRHLLHGIELADSITWDAHKLMFVPSLCTFLLYRDRADSYLPFQQEAPYLFGPTEEQEFEFGLRTFECTKGAIALPVWAMWSLLSVNVFSELIEGVMATTQRFFQMVATSDDFVALHEPQCNIFCFRYTPSALTQEEVDRLQRNLRQQLINEGNFYLTGTIIDGAYALRVTIINPHTEEKHFANLLKAIRGIF